jgi:succinate dehydrogenase / fumarate reductase, iron-sulfur subunit
MMVRLRILRGRENEKSRWQEYAVDVPSDAYVLDAMEAAYRSDATLAFRHACHHASCGSCAVRINGREQLPCIVPVRDALPARGAMRLEPLRHSPRIADLVVDRTRLLDAMQASGMPLLCDEEAGESAGGYPPLQRFENCIECGICVSACPIVGSDAGYIGPAALAASERGLTEPRGIDLGILNWVDTRHGVWRCHGVFACTDACPLQVDPAAAIMRLRRGFLQRTSQPKAKG